MEDRSGEEIGSNFAGSFGEWGQVGIFDISDPDPVIIGAKFFDGEEGSWFIEDLK
jgi:hypothetical protein